MSKMTEVDVDVEKNSSSQGGPERELSHEGSVGSLTPAGPNSGSRIYYGWYMLLMSMGALIGSSPGQTFGISIFNEALREDLGLSHGQLAFAYMSGTLLGAIPILWIGSQMDRRGIRPTMLTAIVVFSLACLVMSLVQNWIQLLIAFTLLRMLGPGALSMLSSNVLPFWFARRLGTVEGLRQTAMALAMAIMPPLNVWLLMSFGWRNSYAIFGGCIFLLMFPLYWRFFRGRPEDLAHHVDVGEFQASRRPANRLDSENMPDSKRTVEPTSAMEPVLTFSEAIHTSPFWLVLAGTSLFGMINTGVFFSVIPIFAEQGLTPHDAASMLVVYAISLACHQVFGGWLSDRLVPSVQLAFGMLLFSAGLTLLWMGYSVTTMLVAGAVLGGAQGMYFAASQPLWARYFGRLHLGKLRGLLMAANVAISSLGPLLVGLCRDTLGGFTPVLILFSLLPLPFLISSAWIVPPNPRTNPE